MGRFERRLKERLKDPLHRAAYYAADAEVELTQAIDAARLELGISQAELGERLERSQSAVSQFLSAENGITIERLVEYLVALDLGATIKIHALEEAGSPPIVVEHSLPKEDDDVAVSIVEAFALSGAQARERWTQAWVYEPASEKYDVVVSSRRSTEAETIDEQSAVAS